MHHTCEETQNKKYLEEIDPTSIAYDFSFQRPKVLFCENLSQNEVKLNRNRYVYILTKIAKPYCPVE